MAPPLPDTLQLREIKYGERTAHEKRRATARQLLEADRVAEALDLLLIVGDEDGIAALRARAVEEGRPVWLLMIRRTGRPVSEAEWRATAQAAQAAGRPREAWRCYTEFGDDEALERLKAELPEYALWTPAGKA